MPTNNISLRAKQNFNFAIQRANGRLANFYRRYKTDSERRDVLFKLRTYVDSRSKAINILLAEVVRKKIVTPCSFYSPDAMRVWLIVGNPMRYSLFSTELPDSHYFIDNPLPQITTAIIDKLKNESKYRAITFGVQVTHLYQNSQFAEVFDSSSPTAIYKICRVSPIITNIGYVQRRCMYDMFYIDRPSILDKDRGRLGEVLVWVPTDLTTRPTLSSKNDPLLSSMIKTVNDAIESPSGHLHNVQALPTHDIDGQMCFARSMPSGRASPSKDSKDSKDCVLPILPHRKDTA